MVTTVARGAFVVIDVVYVAVTVVFFAAMIAYVRACEHLGRLPSDERNSDGESQ
jgi:hypothetical protein